MDQIAHLVSKLSSYERLRGCQAKLDRVAKHIKELEQLLLTYKKITHQIVYRYDKEAGEIVFNVVNVADPVEEVSVVIGDITHGYRSVLDHFMWQLVEASGAVPGKPEFPIYLDEPSFLRDASRKAKGLDLRAMGLLKSLQPFHDAEPDKNPLWFLHELNNIDKHRVLIFIRAGMMHLNVATSMILDDPRPLEDGWFGALGTAGSVAKVCPINQPLEGFEVARVKWHGHTKQQEPKPDIQFGIELYFGAQAGDARNHHVALTLKAIGQYLNERVFATPGLLDFVS